MTMHINLEYHGVTPQDGSVSVEQGGDHGEEVSITFHGEMDGDRGVERSLAPDEALELAAALTFYANRAEARR